MKLFLATAIVQLAGASAGWAQTPGDACGDVVDNPHATCPSVIDPGAGSSFNSGAAPGSGNGIFDNQTTGSIQNPSPDTGFGITEPNATPLVTVPIDPLGQNIGQNPYGGGNQIGIPRSGASGNNGGSIPSIR